LKILMIATLVVFWGMTGCKARSFNTLSSQTSQGFGDFVLPNDENPDVIDEFAAAASAPAQLHGQLVDFDLPLDPKPDTDFN